MMVLTPTEGGTGMKAMIWDNNSAYRVDSSSTDVAVIFLFQTMDIS